MISDLSSRRVVYRPRSGSGSRSRHYAASGSGCLDKERLFYSKPSWTSTKYIQAPGEASCPTEISSNKKFVNFFLGGGNFCLAGSGSGFADPCDSGSEKLVGTLFLNSSMSILLRHSSGILWGLPADHSSRIFVSSC